MKNAYQLDALPDLGIDVGQLGCIMLDVAHPERDGAPPLPIPVKELLPNTWGYTSSNPALSHVNGIQTEHHITLLYGLLPQVRRRHVDEVLDGWTGLDVSVKTDTLDVFKSPIPDEPYACIVARQLSPSREIAEAHARLSLLPHINTHPQFKAHVTLAYVRLDRVEDALLELRRSFGARDSYVPILFRPKRLNYGDAIGGAS